ncbi:MAG TPA: hypothetical protein EYP19_01515 [Desulfobacterales bacterium]|nr:hypothetical protein [Desulfobacterales bacterium]
MDFLPAEPTSKKPEGKTSQDVSKTGVMEFPNLLRSGGRHLLAPSYLPKPTSRKTREQGIEGKINGVKVKLLFLRNDSGACLFRKTSPALLVGTNEAEANGGILPFFYKR